MMKKPVVIATAIALVAAIVFPTLALAQSQEPTPAVAPKITGSLAIVAPHTAPVGTNVQMTVFRAWNQEPVADARVWAVTSDKVPVIKDEMTKLKGKTPEEAGPAVEQALDLDAIPLGSTDSSGKIRHTFADAGRYLLVAFKAGFLPDFRQIVIAAKSSPPRLAIQGPNRAGVGEPFSVRLVRAGTQDGVKDAAVWALTREKAQTLKTQIANIKPDTDPATLQSQVESTLNAAGAIFLGSTNGDGKPDPRPSLPTAGGYLLVTLKPGFRPGLKVILITNIAPQQGSTQGNQGK